jgi:hypothetical protein
MNPDFLPTLSKAALKEATVPLPLALVEAAWSASRLDHAAGRSRRGAAACATPSAIEHGGTSLLPHLASAGCRKNAAGRRRPAPGQLRDDVPDRTGPAEEGSVSAC